MLLIAKGFRGPFERVREGRDRGAVSVYLRTSSFPESLAGINALLTLRATHVQISGFAHVPPLQFRQTKSRQSNAEPSAHCLHLAGARAIRAQMGTHMCLDLLLTRLRQP